MVSAGLAAVLGAVAAARGRVRVGRDRAGDVTLILGPKRGGGAGLFAQNASHAMGPEGDAEDRIRELRNDIGGE